VAKPEPERYGEEVTRRGFVFGQFGGSKVGWIRKSIFLFREIYEIKIYLAKFRSNIFTKFRK
jgi:hypothetical protein